MSDTGNVEAVVPVEEPDKVKKDSIDNENLKELKLDDAAEPQANQVIPISHDDIKHPLQHTWALWFFKNDRNKNWSDNLRLVTKFDTVEDFWAIYNHIQLSSKLHAGCDYNLFKDGIQPMWEDPSNKNGGKWQFQLGKQHRNSDLDKYWLETLLLMIGEGFGEDSECVNGGVVQVRGKGDKSAIWLSESRDTDVVTRIGHVYKARLALPKKIQIQFYSHADTQSKSGSMVKAKVVL